MRSKPPFIALTLLWVCTIFAGCLQSGQEPGPPEKVTLALAAIPDSALAFIAQTRGYFRAEGLAVTVQPCRYGKLALHEMLEGKADFATVAETPVMFAIMEGNAVSVLATIMTSSLSQAVVARKDRGIASVEDLKGKRVAAILGTTSEYFLYSILITRGISLKDLQLVDLKSDAITRALTAGDIDAASIFLPYTVMAQKELGTNALLLRDINAYQESFNVVSSPGYVRSHPGTVKKLLRALIKAELFARDYPEQAQQIVADQTGVRLDIMQELWAEADFSTRLDQALLLSLENESQWAMRNRLTKAAKIPNYLPFIYLDGLQSLKPDAVRILR